MSSAERWNGSTHHRCIVCAPTATGNWSTTDAWYALASRVPWAGKRKPFWNGAKSLLRRFHACMSLPPMLIGGRGEPGVCTRKLGTMLYGWSWLKTRLALATV